MLCSFCFTLKRRLKARSFLETGLKDLRSHKIIPLCNLECAAGKTFPLGREYDGPDAEKQAPNATQQGGKKEKGEE